MTTHIQEYDRPVSRESRPSLIGELQYIVYIYHQKFFRFLLCFLSISCIFLHCSISYFLQPFHSFSKFPSIVYCFCGTTNLFTGHLLLLYFVLCYLIPPSPILWDIKQCRAAQRLYIKHKLLVQFIQYVQWQNYFLLAFPFMFILYPDAIGVLLSLFSFRFYFI